MTAGEWMDWQIEEGIKKGLEGLTESYVKERLEERVEACVKERLKEHDAELVISTKQDGIIDILKEMGTVSKELETRIKSERDPERLKYLNKLAVRSDSIDAFISAFDQ